MTSVERDDVLRFARRDWDALARAKTAFWEDVRRESGQDEVLRAVESSRRLTLLERPGWPGESARDEDLATHVRVTEALARAGRYRRP